MATTSYDAEGIKQARRAAEDLHMQLEARWMNLATAAARNMEELARHLQEKAADIHSAVKKGHVAIGLVRLTSGEVGLRGTHIDMYCAGMEELARAFGSVLYVRDKVIDNTGGEHPDQER